MEVVNSGNGNKIPSFQERRNSFLKSIEGKKLVIARDDFMYFGFQPSDYPEYGFASISQLNALNLFDLKPTCIIQGIPMCIGDYFILPQKISKDLNQQIRITGFMGYEHVITETEDKIPFVVTYRMLKSALYSKMSDESLNLFKEMRIARAVGTPEFTLDLMTDGFKRQVASRYNEMTFTVKIKHEMINMLPFVHKDSVCYYYDGKFKYLCGHDNEASIRTIRTYVPNFSSIEEKEKMIYSFFRKI